MYDTTINNEIRISVPDGFDLMSQLDLATSYAERDKRSQKWGMHDRDRHIMVTVRWEHYGAWHLKATNVRNLAKAQQKTTARLYAKSGYQLRHTLDTTVAGAEAAGYVLTYEVEGRSQAATMLWFKGTSCVYALAAFSRPDDTEAARVIDDIFRSIAFA